MYPQRYVLRHRLMIRKSDLLRQPCTFFQTASAGYLLFTTSSGVTLNSKGGKTKLAGQFSGATLKKIGTDAYDLIGDLG